MCIPCPRYDPVNAKQKSEKKNTCLEDTKASGLPGTLRASSCDESSHERSIIRTILELAAPFILPLK